MLPLSICSRELKLFLCSYKHLYMNVHGSAIANNKKLETAQKSFNRQMEILTHNTGWSLETLYRLKEARH